MSWEMSGWTVSFHGCTEKAPDCHTGKFDIRRGDEPAREVEVMTTMQIEHILAGELGKEALSDEEREIVLAVGGRQLIEQCLEQEGRIPPVLYLSGQILMSEGAERRLLQDCGLLPE